MKRKAYESLRVTLIDVESGSPFLSGSVIEQNNVIQAHPQDVEEVDFSSNLFDITWEE